MSRPIQDGGRSTRKQKVSRIAKRRVRRARRRRPEDHDPDAVDFEAIDWNAVRPEHVELDPALIERIRSRAKLRPITLRVGVEQVETARAVAAQTGTKYQAVLRQWLAEGASRARSARMSKKAGAASSRPRFGDGKSRH